MPNCQESILLLTVACLFLPVVSSWMSTIIPSQQRGGSWRKLSNDVTTSSQLHAGQLHNAEESEAFDGLSVEQALQQRYACTRFERHDGILNTTTKPSISNTTVVNQALQVLEQARRAPSGFNVQPYKLLVISEPQQKELLAQYCIGHNAHRIRDSDCTVIFLADRQALLELPKYRKELLFRKSNNKWKDNPWQLFKIQAFVGMFSQGLPLPYIISAPLSVMFRFAVRIVSWMTRQRWVLPTLSSAETWSQKNTMLVAMSYILGCISRGLATSPMEGYLSWGIRQNLQIPRRYSIPLIVATGLPYRRPTRASDDAGMTHGSSRETSTLRYPSEQVIFQNVFGQSTQQGGSEWQPRTA